MDPLQARRTATVVLAGGLALVGLFLAWPKASSPPQVDLDVPLTAPAPERVSQTHVTSAAIDADVPTWSTFVIPFESGERLRSDGYHAIQRLADALHQNPALEIKLEGHTDSSGATATNHELGLERAAVVKEALMDHGIEGNRIHVAGPGEESPVSTNATVHGRALNRRVEVRAFPTE